MVSMHRDPLGALWGEFGRVRDEVEKQFRRKPEVAVTSLAINVWEDADQFVVEADLPGVDPAKIDIEVNEGKTVLIKGEREIALEEGRVAYRSERFQGQFRRDFTLPSLVDASRVEASYDKGVLRVTLPKAESAKPRKIVVKA